MENEHTYVVSIQQAFEWLKRPTRLEKIAHFPPWRCQNRRMQSIQPCEVKCLVLSCLNELGLESIRLYVHEQ